MLRYRVKSYEASRETHMETDVMNMRGQHHRHRRMDAWALDATEHTICVLADDEPATVVRIEGGRHLASRLHNLGILPGKRIRKLGTMPGSGPVMVDCDGVRIALGRGMAERVIVQPLREAEKAEES